MDNLQEIFPIVDEFKRCFENQTMFYRYYYAVAGGTPAVIRLGARMNDAVDGQVFLHAVKATIPRYPYYRRKLEIMGGALFLVNNDGEIPVFHTKEPPILSSEESNRHLIGFSWWEEWIYLDIFHGITDGSGAYEVMRTLLHYYCEQRYGVTLPADSIRLAGEVIPDEEWKNPLEERTKLPQPERQAVQESFNLTEDGNLKRQSQPTAYHITIPEEAVMRLCHQTGGSPAALFSLLACRAVACLYPDHSKTIRVMLPTNQRACLDVPKAHHSLVGGIGLDFDETISRLPFDEQVRVFRKGIHAQAEKDVMLKGVATQVALSQRIASIPTHQGRVQFCDAVNQAVDRFSTLNVSYIGRAGFGGAEHYVREVRSLTCPTGHVLVEAVAVGGRFELEWLQWIDSYALLKAFLEELQSADIPYNITAGEPLQLPIVKFPWVE